jgi:hypothetical protein
VDSVQRYAKVRPASAGARHSGWITGYVIGTAVIVAVAALVSAILGYARSIADEAPKINAALKDAERNTEPLGALRTTVDDTSAIVGGLQRGRARLGG